MFRLLLTLFLGKEVTDMAVVYATLIIKGYKTLEQVPSRIRKDVEDILRELEIQM